MDVVFMGHNIIVPVAVLTLRVRPTPSVGGSTWIQPREVICPHFVL